MTAEHNHAADQTHAEAHDAMYQTWSITAAAPIRRDNVQALLDTVPEGVLRAKGFVYLVDDPDRRYLLQLVGKRWKLAAGEPWGDGVPETRLVFIGLPGSIEPANVESPASYFTC